MDVKKSNRSPTDQPWATLSVISAKESFVLIHNLMFVFWCQLIMCQPTFPTTLIHPTSNLPRQGGTRPNDQHEGQDWLFERVNLDHSVFNQLADSLTKGTFTTMQWQSLSHWWQIRQSHDWSHKPFCCTASVVTRRWLE